MTTYKRLSFTNEDEKKLIDAIREHPGLWDPNCVEYGNVSLRKYYWKSISQQLHKNASECRRKWRFVRDYYVLKRKRVSNAPDSKYANLSFLDKIIRPKFLKADEILDYQDNDSAMVDEFEEHLNDEVHPNSAVGSTTDTRENAFVSNEASRSSEIENLTEYLNEEKYIEDEIQEIVQPTTHQSEFYNIDENTSDKFTIMNAVNHNDKESTQIVQPLVQYVNRSIQEKDIDLFFQSMASTVKTFPANLVAKAKMKVFSAINELETQLHEQ